MVDTPKARKRTPRRPKSRVPHDPERTAERGMSTEATAADEAETMASTGNAEEAFREVATGTATGLGLDRGESIGTGGLAAGEDLDVVAEGDYWREGFRRTPFEDAEPSSQRYEPAGGRRYGYSEAVPAPTSPRRRSRRKLAEKRGPAPGSRP
jgi:hypothetical protein